MKVSLGWVDYQVLRRTYARFMRKAGVDPKVVADSMGHDLDVNLNTYTQTPLDSCSDIGILIRKLRKRQKVRQN